MKKCNFKGLLRTVVSMLLAVAMSLTVTIPGTAINETVGRFGEVNGSDGKFRWTENGKEKVLNYFYVGKATMANQAFCIEHSAGLNDGSVRIGTESDLTTGSDYWKTLSVAARKGIMYTLLYGFNGKDNKVPDQLKARNSKVNSMDYLAATQFLIWEYTQGYRIDYRNCSNSVFYNVIKGRPAETAYSYILEQIGCHEIKASFLSDANNRSSAKMYTMKWNENNGRYEIVLKDENGNSFLWKIAENKGINVSQNGSVYTFYTDKVQNNTVLELKKDSEKGISASDNYFRMVVFDGQGQSLASGKWDPLSYYIGFTTEGDGSIEITKTSVDNIIDNVDFTVTGKNLAAPVTLSTDSDGKVVFDNLKPGTYTVTEVVPDEKYVSPEPVTVQVTAGAKVELSFHNRIAEYSFKIRKYVMDTEYSPGCADFTFKITGENIEEPIYATTHWIATRGTTQVGEVSVIVPGPGKITVEEVGTDEKYTAEYIMDDWLEIKSDGHNGSIWLRNTPNKGTLKIIKTAEDNNVHGVSFTITGDNLSAPITVVTDENGEVSRELVVGTYTVTENINDRYMSQESKTVVITKDNVSQVEFYNSLKRSDLKIIKTSDTGVVAGKNFRITGAEGGNILLHDGTEVTYIDLFTDSEGVAIAESLPLGQYSVVETDNSVAYREFQPKEVILTDKEAVTTVYMHNELRTGHVIIQKTSEDGIYEGHKFVISGKIFDPEGETEFSVKDFSAEAVTDSEGFASFQVPANSITVNGKKYLASEAGFTVEEESQGRYEAMEPLTGIFVEDGQVADCGLIKVHNILKKGNVEVVKTSEDGVVEGFSFTLSGTSFLGEALSVTGKTDENGVLLFENLVPSDENGYTITENNIPEYYIPVATVTVKVVTGETVTVEFENLLKKGQVKVLKTAEDGQVNNMLFSLEGTSMSGEHIELEAVTDKEGIAFFENVPVSGREGYVLREENVPVKYLTPEEINVSVGWDEVTEVSVSNILKKISSPIIKTDSEGNPLEGAGLAVYTEDNELVFAGLTNSQGMLEGLELTVGKCYYVKEFLAPVGYVLNESVKIIKVMEDGTFDGDCSFVNILESTSEPFLSPTPTALPTPNPTAAPFPSATAPVITESPETGSPEPVAIPETGDRTDINLYLMLASVAALIGVMVVVIMKKRTDSLIEDE